MIPEPTTICENCGDEIPLSESHTCDKCGDPLCPECICEDCD
jgi:rRNA maturation endonuclease Nob1